MEEIIPVNSPPSNDVSLTAGPADPTPVIRFQGLGREIVVDPTRLTDTAYCEEIVEAIRTEGQVRLSLSFVTSMSEPLLLVVIDLMLLLGDRVHYRMRDGGESSDLLAAALELLENNDAYPLVRTAALYIGVQRFPNALEIAANRIVARARQAGVAGLTLSDLLRDLRQTRESIISRQQQAQPEAATVIVRSVLPDAPVVADMQVPPGWRLAENRTENLNDPGRSIPAVVLVRGMGYDVRSSEHQIELAFMTTGGWRTASVAARTVCDAKSVIELANLGVCVTSHTAGVLVQFIDDFRVANRDRIPTMRTTSAMGWQSNGGPFVIGRQTIGTRTADNTCHAQFRHAGPGTDAIADGYASAGTFEDWTQIIAPAMQFPKIRFLLAASIVAPLLEPIEAENLVVDICSETSQGKTTSMVITASGVGIPRGNRHGEGGVIWSWDSTQVWRERALVATSGIPFFLDDTKAARSIEEVAHFVYLVTGGQERGRATIHGTRRRASFKTVAFSSGEEPIIQLTKDGGVRPRVMTLWGAPFGDPSEPTAALLQSIRDGLKNNYGHFLPRFVEFLVLRCEAATLRARYRQKIEVFRRRATNEQGYRMAESAAAISLAAELVHEAFPLPWPAVDPVEPLWNDLIGELAEGDIAGDALRKVAALLVAKKSHFVTSSGSGQPAEEPSGGWYGRWHTPVAGASATPEAYVGVVPAHLNAMLLDLGFRSPDTIYRQWKRRGWLLVSGEAGRERTQYSARINNTLVRLIAIRMTAIEAAGTAD